MGGYVTWMLLLLALITHLLFIRPLIRYSFIVHQRIIHVAALLS